MLKLSIRNAKINDINSIHEILEKSFKSYKKKYTTDAYNATVLSSDELKKRINRSDFRVLVVTFKDQIVGTVSISTKNHKILNIRSMAVLPKFQNRGIGTYILNEICRIAKEKKYMIISLDSFRPLKNAVRFYKKYGFKETGVTTDLYGIEIFEMIKELD